ncbi:DNA topoisomerase 3 [Shewanella khirikhana]|uniref:DNA topoisomerase n=1 Tax=Shewanella khirikhana TaxID=1965282 RepID=A0ABM7DXJ7_9GAMM|nr:DNA topoisomerase 3 [Shewanella khirikhana]AZQ13285.1 DNA topoisomerase 3 [Shewanella khirikhana]
MERLFIAEKPSVARAIAEVLGITGKGNGYIECGSDTITWCFGHMLEQAEPDHYTSADTPVRDGKKIWRVEDLPVIPKEWILHPKADAKAQLTQIGTLLKQAQTVVNCGDPDREGQNLVDEVLTHYQSQAPVLRYWSSGIDSVSVERALNSLFDNTEKKTFGDASIGRQRADWLIGMNLSRAFTLRAERGGSRALITVGRVQTPVLSMVVNRDRDIENFKPVPFHTLRATLQSTDGEFSAKWKAKEEQAGLDSEGRLINTEIADALVSSMTGSPASITEAKSTAKKAHHPLTYSLSNLTVAASKQFGYSAQNVLDTCQALYEKHKLTTYPRTDCGYLPESQFADVPDILEALKQVNPELTPVIDKADPKLKSKTWDDSKLTAHHGIIPTHEVANKSALSEMERNIYELIVRTYIAQFYPVHEYRSIQINIEIGGECFTASGKVITLNGWKDVYREADDDTEKEEEQHLPNVQKGDSLTCLAIERKDAKTKPPSRFNEGTILAAMVGIHKFVDDPAMKKLLREEDGLGTEATRAGILTELKNRGYLVEQGKALVSSPLGRSIVDALPTMVKSPVLTALVERQLKDVESGKLSLDAFTAAQVKFVTEQVEKANVGAVKIAGAKPPLPVSELYKCLLCNHGLVRRPTSTKGRYWWGCSQYPTCTQMYADINGRPNYAKPIQPKETAPQ